MAIYRSLRNLIAEENPRRVCHFFTAATASTFPVSPPPLLPSPLPRRPPLFHPSLFSKWIVFPFQGPLFLSSPPWKLLQSSTPLHLHGNGVVLRRKVEAFNQKLDLIRSRTRFPLAFGSVEVDPRLAVNQVGSKEKDVGILESFVNLPNLISFGRLLSGPLLWWMIANEMYSSAFVGLAISGATDWLDGYVARRMNINSVVGSYLDPLADKVLIGCVALGMVQKGLLHPGLVGIVVLRDVALIGGAVYYRAISLDWKRRSWADFFNLDGTSPQKVEPLLISKVNTVFQLVLVAGALLQPEFGTQETQTWITYLSWLVASTTMASTAAYGAQYMRKRATLVAKRS